MGYSKQAQNLAPFRANGKQIPSFEKDGICNAYLLSHPENRYI
jgi:hypothetical protein